MSWQATKWAMELGLPLVKGAVLKSLAYHAHVDGSEAHPGTATIATESGLTERAVRNNLRALEAEGYIEITANQKGGRKKKTTYRLLLNPEPRDTVNPEPETRNPTTSQDKPGTSEQETRNLATPKAEPRDTTIGKGTVIEPSIEPSESTTVPRWLEILSVDSRWPGGNLNGYIADTEAEYADLGDLVILAQACLEWLETDKVGKTRERLKSVWTNWLKNERKYRSRDAEESGSRVRGSQGQAPREPGTEEERGQRHADLFATQPYREGH